MFIVKVKNYLLNFSRISKITFKLLNLFDWTKVNINFFLKIRKGFYNVNYHKIPLQIRRGTSDIFAFIYVFGHKYHRPLNKLNSPKVILDLGSNVGYTLVDFSLLYPKSKVIGVEMDRDNFIIAKKNTMELKKVKIINSAVSIKSEDIISYDKSLNEDSYHISNDLDKKSKSIINIETITIEDILKNEKVDLVDYLKLDIEGEEGNIFQNGSLKWLKKVKEMQIELHPFFNKLADKKIIMEILKKNDFDIVESKTHKNAIFAFNHKLIKNE